MSLVRAALALALFALPLTAQVTFDIHQYPAPGDHRVLRGDFNRDGNPDVVTWNGSSLSFNLHLNDGTGRFAYVNTPLGKTVSHVAVADFNKDGVHDVAACIPTATSQEPSRTVRVLFNQGDGTFSATTVGLVSPKGCAALGAGDFNLDSNPDLVVAYNSNASGSWTSGAATFLGNGAGGFGPAVVTEPLGPAGLKVTEIAVADLNADARPDLMMSLCCSSAQIQVGSARGSADGRFSYVPLADSTETYAIKLADNNLDSMPDFITRHGGAIGFWQSSAGPQYTRITPERTTLTGGNAIYDGDALDINTDGIKDVIVSRFGDVDGDGQLEPFFVTFLRDGNGNFVLRQVHRLANRMGRMVVADFDRDGRPDVFAVGAGANSNTVALNRTNSATACNLEWSGERDVNICMPAAMMSPIRVHANTRTHLNVQTMKVYVDGVNRFTTTDDLFIKYIPVTTGDHRVTVRAWDGAGGFSETKSVFAQAAEQCEPSATNRTVRICSPENNSTQGSQVRIWAAITDANNVNAVKVYIDGFDRLTSGTTKLIDWTTELSPGTHRITVKAWDYLGSFSSTVYVTVQ